MRRALIALLVACTGMLALPSTAGAGTTELEVDLVSPTAPLTFSLEIVGPNCDAGTFNVVSVFDGATQPVEPISVTEDPSDPNFATMVLPDDTVPGFVEVVATCNIGQGLFTGAGDQGWAAIDITKIIEGPAPPGATFTVNVACDGRPPVLEPVPPASFGDVGAAELPEDFSAEVSFTASGEVGYVYTDHGVDCAITEPQNGGAASVVIAPETIEIPAPGLYEATVTNTFVEPIVIEPTFTG